jgi:hypothetical protein
MSGDLDADGLPILPPLPGGGSPTHARGRSLTRLVLGLRTAVLTARAGTLAAMVVFVEREPIDGVAMSGDRRVVGPEALDEIDGVNLDQITVTEIAPELAHELGSYFLPSAVGDLPANVIVAEDFVRSLARPGRRGSVIVRSADGLGMVFVARGGVALAYREGGPTGGFEQVAELLGEPGATLWARLGPDDREVVPRPEASVRLDTVWQSPVRPPEAKAPALPPGWPAYQDRPEAPVPQDDSELMPVHVPPAPPASPLEVVMQEVRGIIGPHAARIEGTFMRAEPSVEGLRAAAESLRARRLRLLSPTTMELVADSVVAALQRYAAGTTP